MNRKILSFIREQRLISPGDHVICALSGGKDSMAMLHVLSDLKTELGITLSAAHMNHNLRGSESQRDESFVREHCGVLGIPLAVDSSDVAAHAKAQGMGLEEAARNLRYEFLLSLSPDAKIATAHTAEDNLETMLMHLVRGCGLQGLSGIAPVRGRIIRPLLMTDRQEIQQYLAQNNIPHVEDSTNATDFCLRNRIRHHVLPTLMEENPNLPSMASALCLELREDEDYLAHITQRQLDLSLDHGRLSIYDLNDLPSSARIRLLRHYLEAVPQLSRSHLEAADHLCRSSSPSSQLSLPGGYVLRREYQYLVLERGDTVEIPAPITIKPGETCSFGPWQVSCQLSPCPQVLPKNSISLIPPPTGVFILRSRLPGDRITLPGGTKKLSRYLVDQKIPAKTRDTLPIVVHEDQVAGVLPLGADINFRAKPGNDSLILTVKRLEEVK